MGLSVLAQALQFCLGLGMAKGPERPGKPALGPAVLLLVAGVQAAHVEGAEEAALRPSVMLHQGLQAGELSRQVLVGARRGRDFSSSSPFHTTAPSHRILPQEGGGYSSPERTLSCSQQNHTPVPSLSLLPAWTGLRHSAWK